MAVKMERQKYKWMPEELSKTTKVVVFGIERRVNPLEDLIGIIKLKTFDVEKILKEKGFEDASKHIGF